MRERDENYQSFQRKQPERRVRDEGVGGSNPLTPTMFSNDLRNRYQPQRAAYGQIGVAVVLKNLAFLTLAEADAVKKGRQQHES